VTIEVFGERVVFGVGPVPVTETMLVSGAVSLTLVLVAGALARAARQRPDGMAAALAVLVTEWVDDLVSQVVGRPEPRLVTFSGTLLLFIAANNLAGELPGVRAATASLAATSALALVVFFAVPIAGLATRGARGYLGHYVRPNPLLLPLHLISELSRTVALSVRLFGNMMSAHLVVAILVALTGVLVPMPLMALDVLIGLLQAYIFCVLATVYIGAAIRLGDD
jgi:F-type H+-transporting ATPase subunit a